MNLVHAFTTGNLFRSSVFSLTLSQPEEQEIEAEHNVPPDLQYRIFVIAWAIATLFHIANLNSFTQNFQHLMLSFAAIFLIMNPGSIFRFGLFLLLQLYDAGKLMPHLSNHWIFTTFVNLTILHTLLYMVYKKRNFRINKTEFLNTFAPLVRIELIILYFFVVFHKLNTGFFSPAGSCASEFMAAQDVLHILPTAAFMKLVFAYGTIVVEALIPLLLLFRSTRNWGLLIGLVFHCFLAFNPMNGFYDFSSAIFGAYVLFTMNSFSLKVNETYQRLKYRKTKILRRFRLATFTMHNIVLILAMVVFGFILVHLLTKRLEDFFRYFFWTVYSVGFILLFIQAAWNRQQPQLNNAIEKPLLTRHPVLLIFPVLVFLNGLSPYLGLKTENSYAMFSNLRTEGATTNHLLVPVSTQLFDYQKDVVEVISSTDPTLQNRADLKRLMVYQSFKIDVQSLKPERVEYIRNGKREVFEMDKATAQHELLQQVPFLERKFLYFRRVNKYEPQPCEH